VRLGAIRAEEARAISSGNGSLEQALDIAASLRTMDHEERDHVTSSLVEQARELEERVGEKKAIRWYKAATGERAPFTVACTAFKADVGKSLSMST
jgi:hypothetical protein